VRYLVLIFTFKLALLKIDTFRLWGTGAILHGPWPMDLVALIFIHYYNNVMSTL
jgi:hypothetical protein